MVRKTAKVKVEIADFDAAEFLDTDKKIAAYLDEAMRDPDPRAFLLALSAVVRAKGVTEIAKKAGPARESLYKSIAPNATPDYATVHKLLDAIGVRLKIAA